MDPLRPLIFGYAQKREGYGHAGGSHVAAIEAISDEIGIGSRQDSVLRVK